MSETSRPEATRSAFAASKIKPAYQQVADQLRAMILSGDLRSGDRLPSEAELVEHFAVSRSTVREALRVLTSRDLVRTVRGVTGGTFVSDVDGQQVADYLETSWGLMSVREDLDVLAMLEAREILEVPAARLAAERHGQVHLKALAEALEREQVAPGREGRFSEHRTFHQVLVEAAQNPLLSMMTGPVFAVLQAKFLRPEVEGPGFAEVDRDHEEIFAAVAAGDAAAAAAAMSAHLVRLRDFYLD